MIKKVKFGGTAIEQDELAHLVLEGKKIATSSLVELNKQPTEINDSWEIVDSNNQLVTKVKVIQVTRKKFGEIDSSFAEDEGDGTYENWYNIHWNYYGQLLKNRNLQLTEETVLECVWFQKIEKEPFRNS